MITQILKIILGRSVKPFIFKNDHIHSLNLDVKNMGLYIHIPFCGSLCAFCPYFKIKYDTGLASEFKKALINEIHLSGILSDRRKDVSSIYFGGGTPALLADDLPEIIQAIKESYENKGNMGIELHPRDVNQALLEKLKDAGFDMVSIGIQSFQTKCLEILGRQETDGVHKLQLVYSAGFKAVDVDLIFGLPGQTKDDLEKDFMTAVENGATQISTYPFIDFSFAHNKYRPLNRKEKRRMLESLLALSEKAGYERTSVWTFARKDSPKYSSVTRDNFLGFGPSAATLLKDIFKINTFSVEEYIKCVNEGKIPTALTLTFTERDRALYWLFWSAYNLEINRESFRDLFEKSLEDVIRLELSLAGILRYVEKHEGGYRLTPKASYLFHLIEQKYTRQYIDKTWRIAGNDPWPEKIVLY